MSRPSACTSGITTSCWTRSAVCVTSNSVLVVEHDEDTMRAADFIVDVGPGAGVHGGEIIAAGTVDDIIAAPRSITGQYLSGAKKDSSARKAAGGAMGKA